MKTKLIALVLSVLATFHAAAVTVKINIQGSNIVVSWPSQNSQKFIIGYRATLDAANPWTILRTNYPASTSNETVFIVTNVVPLQNFSGGGGGAGGPPGFNAASSSSESTITSSASIAERAAIAEERRAHALKIIMPPPVRATRRQDFRLRTATAESAVALAEGEVSAQSASQLAGNVVSSGFFMVSELHEDVDGDLLPTSFDLALSYNPFIRDTDGDGITDGHEDIDGDSFDNEEEVLIGSDPLIADSEVWTPPASGGVHNGDVVLTLANPTLLGTNSLGILFDASGYTADDLVVTQPSSASLRMQWNVTYIDRGGFFNAAAHGGGLPDLTPAERALLRDAFDEGTSFLEDGSIEVVSAPDRSKIDAISRETLEKYEQISLNQMRKDFEYVRKLQDGTIQVPPGSFNRVLRARLASIHTQFTRLASITGSLARRFGRAVGRALPFIGGIAILANGPEFAQTFIAAANEYARDIREGDDETGSAAILAGHCNDLAPGSGNLVLSYLLR